MTYWWEVDEKYDKIVGSWWEGRARSGQRKLAPSKNGARCSGCGIFGGDVAAEALQKF